MYRVNFDSEKRILHLELEGMWTMSTLARFGTEMLVRSTALRLRYQEFAILSDASRFAVQSSEVAKGFERIREKSSRMHRGPMAIVVGSMLNKLQAERSLGSPHIRIFLDPADARNWLDEIWTPAKAA